MRNRILAILALACGLIRCTYANDIEPSKEFYTAVRAPGAITLDGSLTEWSGVAVLADPRFSIPKGSGTNGTLVLFEEYSGGTWSGPDDQTSAVQVVYDDENVYFGFVVTDDTHQSLATGESTAWNGDSVQLMIASADRETQIALYNYGLGGVEGATTDVYVHHEAGPGGTEAVVKRDSATKKTTYEIKLPAASLDLTPPLTAGTQFGLGMAINDGDTQAGQEGQKGWGGLGAHSIVFGKTPQETALVTLGASQTTFEILGVGTTALIGGDLTDPDNNGNEEAGAEDPSWNWAGITASHEPAFNTGESSFNIFDNTVGGGDAKWCCDDPVEGTPVWVAVEFANQVSLLFFTVTSGNDSPDRDPTDWAIQGSNDGTNYTDIYHFNSEEVPWTERNQVVKFTLPVASAPYRFIRYIAYATPGTLHQINEIEYFGTVGGLDRIFLSAINPRSASFTFRATDVGGSVVDPASVRLTIDNQAVTPVTNVKTGNTTDFTYRPATRYAPGSSHTYALEVRDTLGNAVTNSGSFTIPQPFFPTANLPSPAVVDGAWALRWVFGLESVGSGAAALAALQSVGTPDFLGAFVDTTNSVINFVGGGLFGSDLPVPDAVINHPSGAWTGDNYILYGVGHIVIPEEADYTFGVHSDDGFAMRIRGAEAISVSGAGQLDPVDPEAVLHPGTTGDSNTRAVYHLRQGVYRVEFFYYEAAGGDNGELYAAKGRFLNDTDSDQWRLVGDRAAPQQYATLGVTTNGWSVVSSDPGGDIQLTDWLTALDDLQTTGGTPQTYPRLNVGDPQTNVGVDAFPKNTSADDEDFALRATATLVVPVTGTYVIGFNSDDGAYVKITGQTFTELIVNGTGLSAIENNEQVTCDCLTGDSNTRATITLNAGNYPIEAGMFERGGGAYLRVSGGQQGSPKLDVLAVNGAGSFTTGTALLLTDDPTGTVSPLSVSVSRNGANLVIQWSPQGGTLEFSPSLTSPTWTAVGAGNPATVPIGAANGFYRVRQ